MISLTLSLSLFLLLSVWLLLLLFVSVFVIVIDTDIHIVIVRTIFIALVFFQSCACLITSLPPVAIYQLFNQLFPIHSVNSLVSDHPWYTTKWSLTGGGRLREVVAIRRVDCISQY